MNKTTELFGVVAEDIHGNQQYYEDNISEERAQTILDEIHARSYKHHQTYWKQKMSEPLVHALNT